MSSEKKRELRNLLSFRGIWGPPGMSGVGFAKGQTQIRVSP
jgi:hypothetical protein